MKISDIRVREVSIPRIYDTYTAEPGQSAPPPDPSRSRYQIIELHTDDGHTGLGEISDIARRMNPPSATQNRDMLAEVMVGQDLDRWRAMYSRVAELLPAGCHPELRNLTLFGAEIALLDLLGQRYGAPLYELLGGRCRHRVEVCWVAFLRGEVSMQEELDSLGAEVAEKLSDGFGAFKFKVGTDHQRDLERIRLFRAIAGDDTYLRVDASGVWEEAEAITKIADMAAAGINACETPVLAVNRSVANDHPERIEATADEAAASLARVRAQVPVDIIEHVADLGDVFCAALAGQRAVDVINVIPSQGGGLLRAQRLVHTAQTAGIPALLGSTIELGPGTAAFVHLALATANISVSSDLVSPGLLVDDVCAEPFRFEGGTLRPSGAPGLGVQLDEDKMEKWATPNSDAR